MEILSEGSKVTYFKNKSKEYGVIKLFSDDGKFAFVVYHCNDDWQNYKNYTAQMTKVSNLKPGWI